MYLESVSGRNPSSPGPASPTRPQPTAALSAGRRQRSSFDSEMNNKNPGGHERALLAHLWDLQDREKRPCINDLPGSGAVRRTPVPMETVASGLPARQGLPSASNALRAGRAQPGGERCRWLPRPVPGAHSCRSRRSGQVNNLGAVMKRMVPSAMAGRTGPFCAGFRTARRPGGGVSPESGAGPPTEAIDHRGSLRRR